MHKGGVWSCNCGNRENRRWKEGGELERTHKCERWTHGNIMLNGSERNIRAYIDVIVKNVNWRQMMNGVWGLRSNATRGMGTYHGRGWM